MRLANQNIVIARPTTVSQLFACALFGLFVGCQSMLLNSADPIETIDKMPAKAPTVEVSSAEADSSDRKNDSKIVPAQGIEELPVAGIPAAPWGPAYVVPGEASCSPESLPVYETILVPPSSPIFAGPTIPGVGPAGQYQQIPFAAPPQQAANEPGRAGWLDVLPHEGGPISPDFGLPRRAEVDNRLANPVYVRANNAEATWEALASELTKYFPIQNEQRVEQVAGVLTEGRFETPWQVGATVLEPWRNDSVGPFNRWQSALQTVRKKAIVRVIPAAGGYEIGVRVEKQLEDLPRPERASAGAAAYRSTSAIPTDRLNPIDPIRTTDRWISIGRDEPLEQEMLRRFQSRLSGS